MYVSFSHHRTIEILKINCIMQLFIRCIDYIRYDTRILNDCFYYIITYTPESIEYLCIIIYLGLKQCILYFIMIKLLFRYARLLLTICILITVFIS